MLNRPHMKKILVACTVLKIRLNTIYPLDESLFSLVMHRLIHIIHRRDVDTPWITERSRKLQHPVCTQEHYTGKSLPVCAEAVDAAPDTVCAPVPSRLTNSLNFLETPSIFSFKSNEGVTPDVCA